MTSQQVIGQTLLASTAPLPPLATDVPGAVKYTGASRAQLYKHMRAGLLPAHKNGTRTILFYNDLDRYLRALPRAKFKPIDNVEGEQAKLCTEVDKGT